MADILVIEDEENIAIALDFLLSREGHRHRRIATGSGAVDEIRASRPDVVLLDVMLPDVSGYQIVQALGADGFIAKPFELSELRAELARLLAGPC